MADSLKRRRTIRGVHVFNPLRLRLAMALLMLIAFLPSLSYAQSFTNTVFRGSIKSVEFYNTKKVASFPVITLGSDEQVLLGFDDLAGGSRNLYYTIEHCDANWNSSRLSPAEYLQSFMDDRILDYRYSSATFQKYTHYELKLPNQNIAPKLPGNYILKVYEDGDQAKLVLTRRLYVVAQRVSVAGTIISSSNVATRRTNQKVNFTVSYGGLNVQNPNSDIRVFVMQNARPETGRMNNVPTYVRGNQLIYNDVNINDLPGRNEFRHFDTRSLKLNSERISKIYRDTANTVVLLGDPNRNLPDYTLLYDNDGKYYIINQDGRDSRIDADYANMYFNLGANKTPTEGTPYIVGQFNDYRLDETSRLQYDDIGRWYTNLFLKQGVYDYAYVWVPNATKQPDDTSLEGNYFETENEYQLLVYYRPAGARWEELAGFAQIATVRP
ncbi:DUF5103 domain-containing protein [Mucilaginibacter terrenus]|uniref:DUF5103 domain-containing protein n=1 Tax=Mucilaginibacter terrenus TaxID=2482727 RepID=A0A3E2NMJ0_9SPHI|nr:type IX secretion system plug protein domain-containing protein [Mucilaginibacter terrenus]RFZ82110.1 DUF5103 domain-containing protein [Mucilaginibacter terrenus]